MREPKINYNSGDWQEFRKYLEQLREEVRSGLENSENGPEKTAWLRGKSALIRQLLALPVDQSPT
jgi:hypothetical protein